eukprot:1161343-Pelagomonas_calceolata.AAC.7
MHLGSHSISKGSRQNKQHMEHSSIPMIADPTWYTHHHSFFQITAHHGTPNTTIAHPTWHIRYHSSIQIMAHHETPITNKAHPTSHIQHDAPVTTHLIEAFSFI